MSEKTYTTTEISRICDVYPATVINWIDAGKLRAYTTPGGHRRVVRKDLVEFLGQFRIPIPKELLSDKKSILIIDDDKEICRLIERAFLKYNDLFTVHSVHSGVEALVQIGQKRPELAVVDVVMPGMDGLEVCSKLRSMPETASIKIIAMTGNRSISDKDILTQGIHALFRKPLVLGSLVLSAANLLRISLPASSKKSVSVNSVDAS